MYASLVLFRFYIAGCGLLCNLQINTNVVFQSDSLPFLIVHFILIPIQAPSFSHVLFPSNTIGLAASPILLVAS